MQHHAAAGVDRRVDVLPRAQRGDYDRDPLLGGKRVIMLEAFVGPVDDVVHREGRGRALGMLRSQTASSSLI